jgi:hypothetical protein
MLERLHPHMSRELRGLPEIAKLSVGGGRNAVANAVLLEVRRFTILKPLCGRCSPLGEHWIGETSFLCLEPRTLDAYTGVPRIPKFVGSPLTETTDSRMVLLGMRGHSCPSCLPTMRY